MTKDVDYKWNIIDLFSGAGGLSNGFEQTGNFNVIGAVENNEAAVKTYITNHKNRKDIIIKSFEEESSDITKINFKRVLEEKGVNSSETIILGGPPCQGFSNANRQRNNLISGNNLLVKEFARAVHEVNPVAFLLENVESMNSSVHKFLMQKNKEGTIDIASPSRRKEHLEWLNSLNGNLIELKENEKINLCEIGEEGIPEEWAYYIKENHEILEPIFTIEANITLLKSLERKSRKSGVHQSVLTIKKQLEKTNIELLTANKNPWSPLLKVVSEKVFLRLLNDEEVILKDYSRELGLLVKLNVALTNFKELSSNEIEVSEISLDSNNRFIQAGVTTYNVVQYLEVYFESLGYKLAKGVLTASHFGVPQKRNRFFILGTRDNFSTPVKLPENVEKNLPFTVYDAISDLEEIEPSKQVKNYILPYKPFVSNSPLLDYYRDGMEEDLIYNHVNTDSKELILERYRAIKNKNGRNSKDILELFRSGYAKVENIQNTVYLRLTYNLPSPTVVNVRKSMWSHPEKSRAISIREAARLQSFKDSYKFEGKKDDQYQQIGNAVPPLLARTIAEKMLEILGDKAKKPLKDEFKRNLAHK